MSVDWADVVQHFVGGALLALLDLAVVAVLPGPVPLLAWSALAVWHGFVIGHAREAVQVRMRHADWEPLRASHFWRWSVGKLVEWAAWPAGCAVAAVGVYALS